MYFFMIGGIRCVGILIVSAIFVLLSSQSSFAQRKDVCFTFRFEMDTSKVGLLPDLPDLYDGQRFKLICESCSKETFDIEPWSEHARLIRENSIDFLMKHSNVNLHIERLDKSGLYFDYCHDFISFHINMSDYEATRIGPNTSFQINARVDLKSGERLPSGIYRLSVIYRRLYEGGTFYVQQSTNMHYFTVN